MACLKESTSSLVWREKGKHKNEHKSQTSQTSPHAILRVGNVHSLSQGRAPFGHCRPLKRARSLWTRRVDNTAMIHCSIALFSFDNHSYFVGIQYSQSWLVWFMTLILSCCVPHGSPETLRLNYIQITEFLTKNASYSYCPRRVLAQRPKPEEAL